MVNREVHGKRTAPKARRVRDSWHWYWPLQEPTADAHGSVVLATVGISTSAIRGSETTVEFSIRRDGIAAERHRVRAVAIVHVITG